MRHWRNHDGSDRIPDGLDPDAVLELKGDGWGVSALPAGATIWADVRRYRDTGARSSWRPTPKAKDHG